MAAPWLGLLPAARDRAIALFSACCATAWTLAFSEVTSVSPVWAGVPPTVPSTSPAAFTETICVPGLPVSAVLYCASSPDWPTRSSPANPVSGRCCFAISAWVIGCR